MGSGASSRAARDVYKRYLYAAAARRAEAADSGARTDAPQTRSSTEVPDQTSAEQQKEEWLAKIIRDGCLLQDAPAELREDRNFILDAVRRTRASWLAKFAPKRLQKDASFIAECDQLAGSGLVFTYYSSQSCFSNMRERMPTSGASVPGGAAYDQVIKNLKRQSGDHGAATVWFGDEVVFGPSADVGTWWHPAYDCGRDEVPVPRLSEQDGKWLCMVEGRNQRLYPQVGNRYRCWCCHWLRLVKERYAAGKVICCTVSNIFHPDWVESHGAGSSELSDAAADELGLPRECFRSGKPEGWGEEIIQIAGWSFPRKAPLHPHTGQPLGAGCRWERSVLDKMDFPVYVFFKP